MLSTETLAILILALPVAAFVLLAFFHDRIPRNGDWLATGTLFVCLAFSLIIFQRSWSGGPGLMFNRTFEWLPLGGGFELSGGLMVDNLTAVMLVVVTLVSSLVHLFSTAYMHGDLRYGRYFCSLLLFSASMLGLVLVNNLLFLFVFWELVGLSSYLLIGHWYEKKSASDAAIKAFITTRIGDVGMFIGLMICYFQVGSLQYADLFAAVESGILGGDLRTIAALGIFFGAMGKSAQFPLHVWLPDAMEGPTPVSALIHAATMVAAGVYLTGRMLPLFDERSLIVVAYTGAFTALFAASIALVQDDIKKVLAYSTVSQLGYMIMALGVGGYVAGLFHLTTHAFFKAGLFLGAGAVIHAMHHEQSLSKYGGLWHKIPRTAICYLLCTLALTGFPFFSGFWSKDEILAEAYAFALKEGHWFLPLAGFATVFMTAFYMFRQYFLTFTGKPRHHHAYEHAHEVPWQMLLPLVILGALAVVGGGFGHWFGEMNPKTAGIAQAAAFKAHGYESVLTAAIVEPAHALEHESIPHEAHAIAMGLSVLLGLLGIILATMMYFQRRDGSTILSPASFTSRFRWVHSVLLRKYYIDEFYWAVFVWPTRVFGTWMTIFDRKVIDGVVDACGKGGKQASVAAEIVDRRVVDGVGVVGTADLAAYCGEKLSRLQTGYLRQYFFLTVTALVVAGGIYLALV